MSVPLLDPEKEYTATLSGEHWLAIIGTLTIIGDQALDQPGREEMGRTMLDTAAAIVKQIDPAGWEEAGEELGLT